jgi:sigma-B regulation protein RsbU (phosphoserine phosphatase)
MSERRILVVDDSATIRAMIGSLLAQQGYKVATANDGQLGFDAAKAAPPELILTDFEMPNLNGPGLCRKLKGDQELRGIPVIMLTTLGAIESKLTGLDSGADDYVEKPKSPDDLQELFARIRAQLRIADLRGELAERNAQLERAQSKLMLELELARKVQHALMPVAPKPSGLCRYAVRYRPANQLGGDVYDIVRRNDGRLSLMVADVSGHGVNSAMLSGMVKTLAAPLAVELESPSEVLARLDQALGESFPEDYFCTAAIMFLDEATGAFDAAGVGHPPILKASPEGVERIESDPGLLAMGFLEPEMIGTKTGRLVPGETILIFTDGLPDAMTPSDELFGETRIAELLAKHRTDEPKAILDTIESTIARHTAPGSPSDDINLVLVQAPG